MTMVELTNVEKVVLSTLKDLLELGIASPPRKEVAKFSGFSTVGSVGFVIAMRKLSEAHAFIEYPDSETVCLTRRGIAEIGPIVRPERNEEVHERIRKLFHPRDVKIFNQLLDGHFHVGHEVATEADYPSVHSIGYVNAVATMRTLGILEYSSNETDRQNKLLRLTDLAFPSGRPTNTNEI